MVTDLTEQRHYQELQRTQAALRESERRFREMIDALPAAIYTTDAQGRLTHFNPAAVEFSGRVPELGTDQWCVSWKLYRPDGTPMPHDQCPMAIALKEGRVVRGVEAIAERPDGTRLWFMPYPTPLRDAEGRVVGGINMLLDITERKHGEEAVALLAAIVDSSDDAIISKTSTASSPVGTKARSGCSATRPRKRSGSPSRCSFPRTGATKRLRFLTASGEASASIILIPSASAKIGSRLQISLTISPVRDCGGRIIGASKIARDIT